MSCESDITKRQEHEDQLRRGEARNRALISALPDYLLRLSDEGIVLDFHDADGGSPNFPLRESIGKPIADFFNPQQWESFCGALGLVEQEGAIQVVDYDIWMDSKQHFFEARITKTTLGDVLVFIRDHTASKEAQRASESYVEDLELASRTLEENATQLRELLQQLADEKQKAETANQAKSQFLAVMSHEIRTPLNAVLGMSRLLVDSGLNADQRDMADTVMRSGQGLLEIINDILDFSKIEAGKVQIEHIPFDLEQSLEDTLDMISARAEEKKLDLLFWFDPGTPRSVIGDPGRLRQITLNFISNAIKFTEEGYVLLRAHLTPENLLRIEVEDTGLGIPPEKLPLLFERFTQADSSTTRKFGGTGLGLAIVKQLAALMGGVVEATSEMGKGSRFSIVIPIERATSQTRDYQQFPPFGNAVSVDGSPQFQRSICRLLQEVERHTLLLRASGSKKMVWLKDEQVPRPIKGSDLLRQIWGQSAAVGEAAPAAVPEHNFNGIRILLVEDNIVNQKVGVRLLEKMGCSVDLAANGLEAVEMARELPYNLILMDCQMPEMDGFEASRMIRTLPGDTATIPIVALTAAATSEDRQRCLAAGMNAYLTKPITLDDLGRAIEAWMLPARAKV